MGLAILEMVIPEQVGMVGKGGDAYAKDGNGYGSAGGGLCVIVAHKMAVRWYCAMQWSYWCCRRNIWCSTVDGGGGGGGCVFGIMTGTTEGTFSGQVNGGVGGTCTGQAGRRTGGTGGRRKFSVAVQQ